MTMKEMELVRCLEIRGGGYTPPEEYPVTRTPQGVRRIRRSESPAHPQDKVATR